MSCSNLEAKILNYDSFRVCTKIGSKRFLTSLQIVLTIFDKVFLWTLYKFLVCYSPLPSPNIYNDITTSSCTNIITLKMCYLYLKYGLNISYKILNVLYFTRIHLLNYFSIHDPNNKWSTKNCAHVLNFICFSIYAQKFRFTPISLQKQCLNVHNILHKHVSKHV